MLPEVDMGLVVLCITHPCMQTILMFREVSPSFGVMALLCELWKPTKLLWLRVSTSITGRRLHTHLHQAHLNPCLLALQSISTYKKAP